MDVFGPIPQSHFLQDMGIHLRYESLMAIATPEQRKELRASFQRLIGGEEVEEGGDGGAGSGGGMGFAYQFMAFRSKHGHAAESASPYPFKGDEGPEESVGGE